MQPPLPDLWNGEILGYMIHWNVHGVSLTENNTNMHSVSHFQLKTVRERLPKTKIVFKCEMEFKLIVIWLSIALEEFLPILLQVHKLYDPTDQRTDIQRAEDKTASKIYQVWCVREGLQQRRIWTKICAGYGHDSGRRYVTTLTTEVHNSSYFHTFHTALFDEAYGFVMCINLIKKTSL